MRANMTEKLYRLTLKFCDEFENGHSSVPASSTVHCWKNFLQWIFTFAEVIVNIKCRVFVA